MSKARTGAVALAMASACLAIATSAFQAPRWLGFAALAVMVLALIWFASQLPAIAERIPLRIRRHNPELDKVVGRIMRRYLLRTDLQTALSSATDMKKQKTSVTDLRAFADNIARRLRDEGYDMTAKRMEVNLPDNADDEAITKRLDELWNELVKTLIWDRFE